MLNACMLAGKHARGRIIVYLKCRVRCTRQCVIVDTAIPCILDLGKG